jgi:integrase
MDGHYDLESFEEGHVVIYRRCEGGTYHVRLRFDQLPNRYFRRSLKTRDRDRAKVESQDLWADLRVKAKKKEPVFVPSFREVATAFLKIQEGRKARKKLTEETYNNQRRALDDFLVPYLGSTPANKITNKLLGGFGDWRRDYVAQVKKKDKSRFIHVRENITDKTHKDYIDIVYMVLNYAHRERIIDERDMPNWRTEYVKARRPTFEPEEFKVLLEKLGEWVSGAPRVGTDRAYFLRNQFRYWFQFMAGTGLRIGEARVLRWKDIDLGQVDANDTGFVAVKVRPHTDKGTKVKTGERTVVGMPEAATALIMLKLHYASLNFTNAPESYVFRNWAGGLRKKDFEYQWKEFLNYAKLTHDGEGRRYDPYCLRHWYASERIRQGVAWDTLAENLGHSNVDMLREHYKHVKTIELAAEINKRRQPKAPKPGKALKKRGYDEDEDGLGDV